MAWGLLRSSAPFRFLTPVVLRNLHFLLRPPPMPMHLNLVGTTKQEKVLDKANHIWQRGDSACHSPLLTFSPHQTCNSPAIHSGFSLAEGGGRLHYKLCHVVFSRQNQYHKFLPYMIPHTCKINIHKHHALAWQREQTCAKEIAPA